MPQVDFYILSEPQQRDRFACRLVEKTYRLGHRVYVHTEDAAAAQAMDEMLWTFRGGSFVPHEQYSENRAAQSPVVVGYHASPATDAEVLINLSGRRTDFYGRFERVAEVIDGDEQSKLAARERYRFYRDRGYPLETHQIDTHTLATGE
jgi:DNA polymerase-3 subunit chi